jgi:hypothetical protein
MRGLGPYRTRYAGASSELFGVRKRFKKGGSSSPPAAQDPFALGEAQKQSNIATAQEQAKLSNVNTSSPFSQSNFTLGDNGQWNLAQTLVPQFQNLLYGQGNLATSSTDVANRLAQQLLEPSYTGVRLVNAGINNLTPEVTNSPRPDLQPNIDFGSLGALPTSNFQTGLDFSKLGSLGTSAPEFGKAITDAENAAYNTQTRFLDPQFANKTGDLRQQLADEGIPVGSEAYSRAQDDLGRQSALAYGTARDAATSAGQAEQARLFGEQLSGRQQGAGEIQAGGAFTNSAEQQRIADLLAGRAQGSQELGTAANFRNATAQQAWQDPLTALASIAGTGSGLYGSTAQDLATLNPLAQFEWAGAVPTFGGSPTAVSPANVVGAGQVGANSAANRFAASNMLNNQMFNGLGSLGGALGLGNGGLGSLLGGIGGSGLSSGLTGAAALPGFDTLGGTIGMGAADVGGGGGFLSGLGSLLGFL